MALTLEQALTHPTARRVVLMVITIGQRLVFWTAVPASGAWWASTSHRIVGVREDGVALDEAADLSTCGSTDGSWWWDSANGRIYVNPAAADPRDAVVLAMAEIRVGTHPKHFDSIPWRPRIESVPEISLRVPERFGEIGQVGGGSVRLLQDQDEGDGTAGWFDDMEQLDWDAGLVQIYLGVDL